jgi:hypothetical protein
MMNTASIRVPRPWFALTLALAGLSGFAAPALAVGDFACVRCSGPDRTYRCRALGGEAVPAPALRFFCMTQIARDHVHESCAVLRSATSCDGQDVSYVYQDDAPEPPARSVGDSPAPAKEPSTLAEMTRENSEDLSKAGKAVGDATVNAGKAVGNATMQAGRAVGDATVKAGQAVNDATKRTLKCLGSALNDC